MLLPNFKRSFHRFYLLLKTHSDTLRILLKGFILIGTTWYLIYVLFYSQDFQTLLENVQDLQKTRYLLMPLVAFLMLANWGFEALKWQYLMQIVHPVSLKTASKAVLSGVSVSALLPNRIAEYLGRIFYIPPSYRVKAIIASIVGSLAQFLISVVVGSLAFIAYFYYPFDRITINMYMMVMLIGILNATLLLAYFNIPTLFRILPNKGYLRKVTQYLKLIGKYDKKGLWRTLLFAFARYAIFVSQFYLLLYAFQVTLSIGQGIIVLPVVFLAQTLIPTIALAEIGVRGVTAVHFIGFFSGHSVNILAATYGLWLINILLPALIGALLMVFSRSPQTDSDEWSK